MILPVNKGQIKINGKLYENYALKDVSEADVAKGFIASVGKKDFVLYEVRRMKTDIQVCYSKYGQIDYAGNRYLCNAENVICHKEGDDVFIDCVYARPLNFMRAMVNVVNGEFVVDGAKFTTTFYLQNGEYMAKIYANVAELHSNSRFHGLAVN